MKCPFGATYIFSLFVLAVSVFALVTACNKNNVYRVYYVPFEWRSYGAMDEHRIEKEAIYVFELRSANVDELYRTVARRSAEKGEFKAALDIRIELVRQKDGEIIYIDWAKDVISSVHVYSVNKELIKNVVRDIVMRAKDSECRFKEDYLCDFDVYYEINH